MEHEQLLAVTFTGWVKVRLLHKIIGTINQWAKFRAMVCLTHAGFLQTIPVYIVFLYYLGNCDAGDHCIIEDLLWFKKKKKKGHFTLSSHTLMHCNVGALQPSIKKDWRSTMRTTFILGLIKLKLSGICSVNKEQSLEEGSPWIENSTPINLWQRKQIRLLF